MNKRMFFCSFLLILFGSLFFFKPNFIAAENLKAGAPKINNPTSTDIRNAKVSVLHEGTDTIGIRLSTKLKELFNSSNLFNLNEENVKKIRIMVTSKSEFKDRPHVGSVYSVLWVYSQSNSHLGYLLEQEVGVLSPEDVNDVASRIVERTDGLAVKYNYLFK